MPIKPLPPCNVGALSSVDDALALLDANIGELMVMCDDQATFGPKELWMVDKNILTLKGYCDRLETLIKLEKK